ncbi:unnamed protein product [Rangifer tarandus platyrhynchus]|uniref:Uncharacterized protein n=1 Tax=Rangifer tarandus platyrhynchus TaxID=3082113 RepID=A0AC60A7J4_RANTA
MALMTPRKGPTIGCGGRAALSGWDPGSAWGPRGPGSVTRCAMCYSLCGGDRDEPGSPLAAAAAAAAAAAPAAAARTPSPRAHLGAPERSAAAGPVRPRAP